MYCSRPVSIARKLHAAATTQFNRNKQKKQNTTKQKGGTFSSHSKKVHTDDVILLAGWAPIRERKRRRLINRLADRPRRTIALTECETCLLPLQRVHVYACAEDATPVLTHPPPRPANTRRH